MTIKKTLIMFASIVGLAACSLPQSSKSLYHWDSDYSKSVYETLLQEGDPQARLQSLEKMAEIGKDRVPPGLYAQIGLLYSQQGNLAGAKAAFEQEMRLFPESKQYLQFLLTKGVKGGKK